MNRPAYSNSNPLTGTELLEAYERLKQEGLAHKEIAVQCGYYSENAAEGPRSGMIRAATSAFNAAFLAAQGFEVDAPSRRVSRRVSTGVYHSVVRKTGTLTVSSRLIDETGMASGDVIDWVIDQSAGFPRLVGTPRSTTAADSEPAESIFAVPDREQMKLVS